MEKALIFKLSSEAEYTKDGDFTKTASLEFAAPSMACFEEASDFQQLVARAFMSAAKASGEVADPNAKAETPTGKEIKIILNASDSVRFTHVAAAFRTLACKVGTFDGVTPMLEDHFAKLDMKDFENMICEYIANFTFPSLFAGL